MSKKHTLGTPFILAIYLTYMIVSGILAGWLLNRFYIPPPQMIGALAAIILALTFWFGAIIGAALAWCVVNAIEAFT